MNWIPVNEEKPLKGETVIAKTKRRERICTWKPTYYDDEFLEKMGIGFVFDDTSEIILEEITHWRRI